MHILGGDYLECSILKIGLDIKQSQCLKVTMAEILHSKQIKNQSWKRFARWGLRNKWANISSTILNTNSQDLRNFLSLVNSSIYADLKEVGEKYFIKNKRSWYYPQSEIYMKEGFKRIRKIIAQGIMTKLQRAGKYSRSGLRFIIPRLESRIQPLTCPI